MLAELYLTLIRITEDALHESIDARTESLAALRELGPPDLVHLLKQGVRNPTKQVRPVAPDPNDASINILDWHLSSCHRNRRVLVCQPCSIHQYLDS